MKKLLALLLALAMMLGALPAFADAAEEEDASALPAVGDVVEGFEVKEIRPFDLIGADLVLFEHQKTGAKLLYIANDDTNRAFQLTFPTRMENDKGIPHVFEHGTLSGSAKYPSTSLWMNVASQTYNTYMNAYTTDAMTCYPIASLSEAQLLKLADMYTDMCLNPSIMENESIWRTEAWRYEMADADAPLTYNGTVYSEMLGSLTIDRVASTNAYKATFPGASVSYQYGGDPDVIPEMTWEDLKEYHNKYYHPSNCIVYLYGDFEDYTAFLKLLDEAFAPFDRAEISLAEPGYTPITEPAVTSVGYPVAEGTDTANQTLIEYYIVCPGMKDDLEQETLIDHAGDLMGDSASPLMQALRETFPAGSFSIGRELAAPDDAVCITATGLNEGDAELFKATADAALAKIAESTFAPELVDNIVTSLKFNAKLASENGSPVTTIIESLAYYYAVSGDVFRYLDNYESLSKIEEENNSGLLNGAVAKWLVNPSLYTVTTTSPAPGEKEAHDAALAEKLAGIKAGMTAEEIQAIVDATNAAPAEEDNSAMLADLTAVTVATLPEEVKEYDLTDTVEENGVRRIEAAAGVDGISYIMLNLDVAGLPQEDIHYLRLFTRLLGSMDTDRHTWQELDPLATRYLHDKTFGVFCSSWKENFHPYMITEWYSLDEDLETGYALAEEILFHTQFKDTKTLQERIGAQKNLARSQINQNAVSVLLYRQLGKTSAFARYYNYLNFLDYYAFLESLEQKMAEQPEEVIAGLERVQQFLANRSGAVAAFAGNEASLAMNRTLSDSFFAKLDDTPREPAAYDLPAAADREGLIVDSNIEFNLVSASWTTIDGDADGKAYAAIGEVVSDQLLIPVLRDQMGAYGASCVSTDEEIYLYTYRDPNIAETFAYFDTLPDAINNLAIDQATIDRYIISAYSGLAMTSGELSGAIAALNRRINGAPDDSILQAMHSLKTATPETLKTFAAYIADMLNNGVRGTTGSAAAINANAEMYEAVLNPFNAQDLSKAEFDDLPEDHEKYQFVKAAIDQQFLVPRSETHVGVDEEATVGDLLGAVYLMVGGPTNDPAACKDLLVQNGLASPDLDLDNKLTEGYLSELFTVLGAQVSTDTPDLVMTRGDLAQFLTEE